MALSRPAAPEEAASETTAGLRADLRADLVGAAGRGELAVAYQPVVWMETGRPVGFEALLRWHHPDRGTISPADLMPAAEETGAIVGIGEWVLGEAMNQAFQWRETMPGFDTLMIGINVSGVQLQRPGFTDTVQRALDASRLDPAAVLLELTESVQMPDMETAVERVLGLRDAGVKVALDDFGTGYSPLTYLRDLPVTTIKVDRSFVQGLQHPGSRSEPIVRAILDLAHGLGMEAIVEGVETADQEGLLRQMGATLAQGYRWGRPLEAADVPAWLRSAPAPEPGPASR
jgi:EAL domain-containing protein (putative c-di-GMP-specific phosphodiesterase class I)